jgi:hypothetical protein
MPVITLYKIVWDKVSFMGGGTFKTVTFYFISTRVITYMSVLWTYSRISILYYAIVEYVDDTKIYLETEIQQFSGSACRTSISP